MRGISYMYEKSGGVNRFHECSECRNYIQPERDLNYKSCALHPEHPMTWKPDHMACKFFSGEKTEEELADAEAGKIRETVERKMNQVKDPWSSHQMTIDEWIEEEGI